MWASLPTPPLGEGFLDNIGKVANHGTMTVAITYLLFTVKYAVVQAKGFKKKKALVDKALADFEEPLVSSSSLAREDDSLEKAHASQRNDSFR